MTLSYSPAAAAAWAQISRELSIKRLPAVLGLLALCAPPSYAAQVDYGIGYAGETSSNIRRTSTNPEHEWSNSIIGGFTYAEDTADFTARATLQGEYRDYAHNRVPDQSLFFADAAALWTLSPQRLTWTVEDSFREVSIDPTAAPTTLNLAGANVFSTGPDLYLHLGPVNTLSLGARYGNLYVGDEDVTNNRYTGTARWLYQSSPSVVWSANYEFLRVEFENDVRNENFDRRDAFLRLEKRYARSIFTADAGRTNIERERTGDVGGSLVRLDWRRELTSESSFGLRVTSAFEDLGTELQSLVTGPTAPVGGVPPASAGNETLTNDVYYLRQADAFYTRRGPNLGWAVRAVDRHLDYKLTPQDRDEAGGTLEANYFYSALTTFTLFGDYLKAKYLEMPRRDTDKQIGLRMTYVARRNLTLGFEARRVERTSTDSASEFVDDRFLVTLSYSTGRLYTPLVR